MVDEGRYIAACGGRSSCVEEGTDTSLSDNVIRSVICVVGMCHGMY